MGFDFEDEEESLPKFKSLWDDEDEEYNEE